jgi:predicted nuclease of restriction endonuclease-like (RecB) superfamily
MRNIDIIIKKKKNLNTFFLIICRYFNLVKNQEDNFIADRIFKVPTTLTFFLKYLLCSLKLEKETLLPIVREKTPIKNA